MQKVAEMRKYLKEQLKCDYHNQMMEIKKMSKSQLRDCIPETPICAEEPEPEPEVVKSKPKPKPKPKPKANKENKPVKISKGGRVDF